MTRRADTLSARLSELAETRGDEIFIIQPEDGTLSFRQVDALASRAAIGLRELGLGPGDAVALMAPTSVASIACMLGAWRVGALVAMVNPVSSPREVGLVLRKSRARLFVTDSATQETLASALPAGVPQVELSEVGRDGQTPEAGDHPEGGATMIFTSGTTAEPKAVVYKHGHQWHGGTTYANNLRLGEEDLFLHHFPLFHMNGLNQFGAVLVSGARMLLTERFRSSHFDQLVSTFQPTVTFLNGTHVKMLRSVGGNISNSALRAVGFALQMGEEDYDWFVGKYGAVLVEGYGQTESVTMCLSNPLDGLQKRFSCGVPISSYSARLVDEDGKDVPVGQPGSLLLKSTETYGLMHGYEGDEGATAEVFVNGWLRTGDVLRQDDDGYFYYVEREKDIIKRAGENISATEVEDVIEQIDGVAEASVVARPDTLREELPMAFITLEDDVAVTPQQVIDHCRRHLTAFKVPVDVVVLGDFPRTAVGKIEKRTLRAWAAEGVPGA